MKYVLAIWISSEEGSRPDLPDGCDFSWIAGESRNLPFGLFEISDSELLDQELDQLRLHAVTPSLAVLLDSCRSFLPALAGAVRELNDLGAMSQTRFAVELERLLLARLEGQRAKPYVLARSRICEIGYREEGEFVWVVGYKPSQPGQEVTWIASDFQVYTDAIGTFDLDPEWLAVRFELRS